MMTSQESRQYLSLFELYAQYYNNALDFWGCVYFISRSNLYLFTFDIEIIDIVLHGMHNHKKVFPYKC